MLCSAVNETADSPLPAPPLSQSRSAGEREEGERKREQFLFAMFVISNVCLHTCDVSVRVRVNVSVIFC